MAGLFDFGADDDEKRQNIGLLALLAGGNMLAANGPGVTTGQALGTGIAAGAQGMQQMQVNQLRRQQLAQQAQMQQAQIEQLQYKTAQEKARTEALQRMFAGGQPGGQPNMADVAAIDPKAALNMALGLNKPAATQEWEAFSKLPDDQKIQYLNMKRAQTWRDFGGYQAAPNPVNPALPPVATVPNTLRPGEDPSVRGEQARSTEVGKSAGQAQTRLPGAEMQAQQMMAVLDGITNHPALPNVVGMPQNISGFTARVIGTGLPGSPEADFMSRVDQLKGQQFLQAYEALKGGGQITEVEGRKAESAIARMQNLNLGRDDYVKAADELRGVISSALDKARTSAGKNTAPPPSLKVGAIVDGWEYLGGDPNNRMSWREP